MPGRGNEEMVSMRQSRRWRILGGVAVAGGALLVDTTPAGAHVEIDPGSQPKGGAPPPDHPAPVMRLTKATSSGG
jgi:hypothetical protein